nr:unnamed protein product [Spirometra erinaceieuropaei]
MNPLTNTKNQNLINERELRLGYTGKVSSWHRQYKDSAWIFIGGLSYELTEGDVICAFSQYGEVANINLVRDRDTGKPKGFAFLCYENQKSTILATDNLNGIKLGGRTIRVDHVEKYKVPHMGLLKVGRENPDQIPPSNSVSDFVRQHGCGPEAMQHISRFQRAKKAGRTEQVSSMQSRQSRSRSPGLDHGDSSRPHLCPESWKKVDFPHLLVNDPDLLLHCLPGENLTISRLPLPLLVEVDLHLSLHSPAKDAYPPSPLRENQVYHQSPFH